MPQSSRICSATILLPARQIGTPVPGCVLAPTKYRLLMSGCFVLGRKDNTLKKLWLRPRMAPLSRLNIDCHVCGVLTDSWTMRGARSTPVRPVMVEMTVRRAKAIIAVQSCGVLTSGSKSEVMPLCFDESEDIRWPTGTRTATASLPFGAAVGSIREGTFT